MTNADFVMFRDFIHEKCGIYFNDNKQYLLKNRLQKRMDYLQIKSFKDYFFHIKYDKTLQEFNQLMIQITTNETSFYRNEPQLQSFSKELLPKLIEEKTKNKEKKHLRIWSAGCSTGEEPYTLAILIMEYLAIKPGWTFEIVASDISEEVLHTARTGEYKGNTLRNIKPSVLSKYFTKLSNLYKVNPEVKSKIKFSQLNLNEPRKLIMHRDYDVIFCRNVMIYFSDEVKKQLVRGFFNGLNKGGYFYIGHSETLHGISKSFKLVYFSNALVYHKEPTASATLGKADDKNYKKLDGFKSAPNSVENKDGAKRAMDLLSKIKTATAKS